MASEQASSVAPDDVDLFNEAADKDNQPDVKDSGSAALGTDRDVAAVDDSPVLRATLLEKSRSSE